MARIRSIKPEFPQSESMGRVSRDARLCFIQIWTIADDSGRLRGNSRMLSSLLFPYDEDAPGLINGWLEELEQEECIIRYQSGGNNYIQVCKWSTHQKIDKPSPSKIPPPENIREDSSNGIESSSEDQGRDQGEEGDNTAPPAAPEPHAKKPFIPPKGVIPASQLPAKSEWAGTELRFLIEDSFGGKNLGPDQKPRYANWPKEQKAINSICSMIHNLSPGAEITAAKAVLSQFWTLTQGTDKYWTGQPFTPSGLSPVFDRVFAMAKKRSGTGPPGGDLLAEYERQQAEKGAAQT